MDLKEFASYLFSRIPQTPDPGAHQQVARHFRSILDILFRYVTRDDKRTFSNLYARIQYACDKHAVPHELQRELAALRLLTSKVVYRGDSISPVQILLAVRCLSETVSFFLSIPVPEELRARFAGFENQSLAEPDRSEEQLTPLLKPVIVNVGDVRQDEAGRRFFTLDCREESVGRFNLVLTSTDYNDFCALQPFLKPYDTLNVLNSERRGGDFYSVLQTQIVLEPDLLLDISEIAECFTSRKPYPLHFILRKIMPQTYSESAFRGNMVNAVLDAVIRKKSSLKDMFKEAVAENAFQAASYGREVLNRIYSEITHAHWGNLSRVAAQFEGKPVRLEPSFFSAIYGLQGRLDVMVENDSDPLRKEILELKSGRAPDSNTWVNHGMQVVGYNMLLSSTFGKERRGSSAILYSGAQSAPLRNVTSNILMENRLLAVRNEVVARLMQLADGNYDSLMAITPNYAEGLPSFSKTEYAHFFERYSGAGQLARSYYQHFLSFLLREYLNAKCGMYSTPEREDETDGYAALWLKSEDEKLSAFSLMRKLRFSAVLPDSHKVAFLQEENINHNFRPGDTVILYPRSSSRLEPGKQQMVKARIDLLDGENLVLSLNNHQLDSDYFSRFEDWVIEHDMYESTFWTATRGLFHVLGEQSTEKFELLMGLRAPRIREAVPDPPANDMNGNQREILLNALRAKDYYLLQGPPGTGKTSTLLTNLVLSLLDSPGSIVIVAFTNRAVEEIAHRLDGKGVTYMRIGSRHSVSESTLRSFCREGRIEEAANYIRGHRIFLGTVASLAGRTDLIRLFRSDLFTLIVDEASQLTEPQLLPLVMEFRKFILIGDQNQLPPVVAQNRAFLKTEDPLLNEHGVCGLNVPLFERLIQKARRMGWTHSYGMLNTHFRMHEEIASLINHYYGYQLQCGTAVQREQNVHPRPSGLEIPSWLNAGRAIFIPSAPELGNRYHEGEAIAVGRILKLLGDVYGAGFNKDTVGIISPWRTQVGRIRGLVQHEARFRDLNIDTVERFQGSENDVIIVSMAVNHSVQLAMVESAGRFECELNGKEEEIEVDRKLLVTISRARRQVILLGDEAVLRRSPHYDRLLNAMIRVEYSDVVEETSSEASESRETPQFVSDL